MTFSWDILQYPSVAAYEAALAPFRKPAWISGITLHHTWSPTARGWEGERTMIGLKAFYKAKGWSAGPHLFLCAGSPHPANDGIWAGTPLVVQGVHAGVCNSDHIGIEIVGDYDDAPWPPPVADLVFGVVLALMRWGAISPARVQGHRECLPNKSCPGRAIDMNVVRADLTRLLAPPQADEAVYRVSVSAGVNVRVLPTTQSKILATLPFHTAIIGHEVSGTPPPEMTDRRWVMRREGGYVWRPLLDATP
jgi:hypothetical protein